MSTGRLQQCSPSHAGEDQRLLGHGAVCAKANKSQPPAEQGHLIKVYSGDLFPLQ